MSLFQYAGFFIFIFFCFSKRCLRAYSQLIAVQPVGSTALPCEEVLNESKFTKAKENHSEIKFKL
jgi:hypothetical protein